MGSVRIKSKEAPSKDVLKDLVEMCRGIQHPVRGLFLRSYLSQISRDKLPDIGSEYGGDADTVMDAVEFILQNFTEMNKLWAQMQHQVGKNLHVLSQIEGADLDMYKKTILPRVLEQLDEEDFKEEQNSVARLIHLLYNDDPEEMLLVADVNRLMCISAFSLACLLIENASIDNENFQ